MTEAAQTRLTYITGIRDDLLPSEYEEPPDAEIVDALLDALRREAKPLSFRDVPNFAADDLAEDLRWVLERLRAAGIERVVAVDLTRAGFRDTGCPRRDPRSRRRHQPPRLHPRPRGPAGSPCHLLRMRGGWGQSDEGGHFRRPVLAAAAAPGRSGRSIWRPPARQGDVYRAALARPAIIGIIDGYFETMPTVWHKEILWAMAKGIHVYGAASIGALRAAELDLSA